MTLHPDSKSEKGISEFQTNRSFLSFFKRWEWILVVLIAGVVVLNTNLSPYFLNANNLSRTSSDFMEIGLMMLPMVFIIITGNIDLSVASIMGMSASLMGLLHNSGVNIWVAAAAGLLLGSMGGALNGYLIGRIKLPALVVTLGTYAFYRGLAYGFLGDQAARNYPPDFTFLGQGKVAGSLIPVSVALFIGMAILFGLILHKTSFGRYLYSIGNNEEAALYSGVPVKKIIFRIYLLSGFISALAGLVLAARFGSTRPDNGTGLELSVITAAVLGGVDIDGGKGTLYGAFLSLILIGLLRFGMGLLNIQGQVQSTVIGLLLIFSILFPQIIRAFTSFKNSRAKKKTLLAITGLVVLYFIFFVFFFWSRAPILNNI